MNGTAVKDRVFKTTILVFLILSILIQILVSAWFYDKLEGLDNRLSLYPVDKPVDVDLKVTVPELVEIDRKIERLAEQLNQTLATERQPGATQRDTESKGSREVVKKKAKPRMSTQVDIIEKIGN